MEEHNLLDKVCDDARYMREHLERLQPKFSLIGDVRGMRTLENRPQRLVVYFFIPG